MIGYRFTRPPRMIRRAKKDNVALVPGSLLSQKALYQHIANSLPRGAVLIVLPTDSPVQKQAMLDVARQLGKQGLQVSVEVSSMVDVWCYPANWPAISLRIRERDGQRCRWCGVGEALFDLNTGRTVLLTTMHLDGDPWNCANWNLVTACRPCHAAYDAPQRVVATADTRRWTRIEAGQLELFPDLF